MQTIGVSSSSSSLRSGISRIGIDTHPAMLAVEISHGSRTSSNRGAGRDSSASQSARAGGVRFCMAGGSELEAWRFNRVQERFDVSFEDIGNAELLLVHTRDDLCLH